MYLPMAWRDEPPLSFKVRMAEEIISAYLGWEDALVLRGTFLFLTGLLARAGLGLRALDGLLAGLPTADIASFVFREFKELEIFQGRN